MELTIGRRKDGGFRRLKEEDFQPSRGGFGPPRTALGWVAARDFPGEEP